MFKILSKLFGGKKARPAVAPIFAPDREPGPASKPDAVVAWENARRVTLDRNAPPEQLCGLTPEMTQDQIREHLALLYRRHNRAASSLDATLRTEAEVMLNAVVRCREKLLGVPAGE